MKSDTQNFYFIIFIIFFATLLVYINISHAQELIFSEIMYDPQGSDTGNEWVEIFNKSTSTINIEGDFRFNNGSNHVMNLVFGLNNINSEEFFVITNNAANFLNNYPNYSSALFESSFSLNNTSGLIKILQGTSVLAEQEYISFVGANDNGKTLERINLVGAGNTWQESYIIGGTPGLVSSVVPENIAPNAIINVSTTTVYVGDMILFDASSSTDENINNLTYFWSIDNLVSSTDQIFNYSFVNSGTYNISLVVSDGFLSDTEDLIMNVLENNSTSTTSTIDYSGKIIINELLPNPEGSDDTEWIEIKNVSEDSINLENWYIQDASAKKYIFSFDDFDNLILDPGEFLVLEYNVSGITLNNSSDSLYLFDNYNNKIFETTYSNSIEGNSWANFSDAWKWTNILTKGQDNKEQIINFPQAIIDIAGEFFVRTEINFSGANSYDSSGGELSYKWYINNYLKSREEQFKITFDSPGTKSIKLVVVNTEGLSSQQVQDIEIRENLTTTTTSTTSCSFDEKTKIIISELFPNPSGVDDGEFIELYNPNNFEVDLAGTSLNDTSTYFYKLNQKIPGKSFFVVYKKDSKISLNNSSEELKLYDCNKKIVSSVKYDKSIEDKSYSYNFLDETYFWSDPTPDEDNILNSENNLTITGSNELLENEDKSFYGVIVSALSEIKKDIFYICSYDFQNELVDYENCIEAKSKIKDTQMKTGDIFIFYGEIQNKEDKNIVTISEMEKIKNIELKDPEIYEIDDVLNSPLNSFVSIQGSIFKLNKKSLYVGEEDNKCKIKFKDLGDIKLQKADNIYLRGIVVRDGDSIALYIRDSKDILIQKVLAEQIISSTTESINKEPVKKKDFLGIIIFIFSIILVVFFFIKNKLKNK